MDSFELITDDEDFTEIKKIEEVLKDYTVEFEAKVGEHVSRIIIIYYDDYKYHSIFQYVTPLEGSEKIPLFLPNPDGDNGNNSIYCSAHKNSNKNKSISKQENKRREWFSESVKGYDLAKSLYNQKYKITRIANFPVEEFNRIKKTNY